MERGLDSDEEVMALGVEDKSNGGGKAVELPITVSAFGNRSCYF
jgi:hypothetical protein